MIICVCIGGGEHFKLYLPLPPSFILLIYCLVTIFNVLSSVCNFCSQSGCQCFQTLHKLSTLMCLSVGANGKLMALVVQIDKHIRVFADN